MRGLPPSHATVEQDERLHTRVRRLEGAVLVLAAPEDERLHLRILDETGEVTTELP